MLKERVLMKNLQIKMEDNVQYKIETPDGRTTTWDAQKWQSKGSELMAKYPDAKVISIRNADKDTQFDDNSFVGIELSDGRTTTWDAQKWRSKGSELITQREPRSNEQHSRISTMRIVHSLSLTRQIL